MGRRCGGFIGQPCHKDQDDKMAFAAGSIDISQGPVEFPGPLCWRMIFSENRFPSPIGVEDMLFGIMR
jgi:hypothetical protein